MTDLLGDLITRKESAGSLGPDGIADLTASIGRLSGGLTPLPDVAPLDLNDPVNLRLAEIMGGESQLQKAHRFDTYEANGSPRVSGPLRELVDQYRRGRWDAIYELGVEAVAADEIGRTVGGLDVWPDFDKRIETADRVQSWASNTTGAFWNVFLNLGYGIYSLADDPARLHGWLGLEPQLGSEAPDAAVLLNAMSAKLSRLMDGENIPLAQLYRQEMKREGDIEESAGTTERVLRGGGEFVGEIAGIFATPIGRAIGFPGSKLAKAAPWMAKWMGLTSKMGKAPKWMRTASEITGTAIGWGAFQGLTNYYDPETGELNGLGTRFAIAGKAAAMWPVYDSIARGAGVLTRRLDKVEVLDAFAKWAKKSEFAAMPGQINGFGSNAWNTWIAEGMPGMSKGALGKIADRSMVAMVEAGGFSVLDAQMRKDIMDGYFSGDEAAKERATEKFLSTWLGLAAIKAGGIENIPQWKRAQAPQYARMGKPPEAEGGAGWKPKPEGPQGKPPEGAGSTLPARRGSDLPVEAGAARPAEAPTAAPRLSLPALTNLEHMGWLGNKDGVFRLRGDEQRTFRITEGGEVQVSESLLPVIRDSQLPPLEALREATLQSHLEARRLMQGLGGREVDTDGGVVIPSPDPRVPSTHIVHRFGSTYQQEFFGNGPWRKAELPAPVEGAVSPQQGAVFEQLALMAATVDLPPDVLRTAIKTLEVIRDVPREVDPVVNDAMRLAESGVLQQVAQVDPVAAIHALATVAAGYQTAERAIDTLEVGGGEAQPEAMVEPGKPGDQPAAKGVAEPAAEVKPATVRDLFDTKAMAEAEQRGKGSRSRMMDMPIDEFLALAKPFGEAGPDPKAMERIRSRLQAGEKLDEIPEMTFQEDVRTGEATVVSHEGRHRALALKELGYESMPVEMKSAWGWGAKPPRNIQPEGGGEPRDFPGIQGSEAGAADPRILAAVTAAVGGAAVVGSGMLGDLVATGAPYAAVVGGFKPWAMSLMDRVRETGTPATQENRDWVADRARKTVDDYNSYRGDLSEYVTDMLWKTTGMGFDPRVVLDSPKATRVIAAAAVASFALGPIGPAVAVPLGIAGGSFMAGRTADARGYKQATRKLEEIVWEPVDSLTIPEGITVVAKGEDWVEVQTSNGSKHKIRMGATRFHRSQDDWGSRSELDRSIVEEIAADRYAANIAESGRTLEQMTGHLAEMVNLQIKLKGGEIVPFRFDPNHRRMVRVVTPEQIAIRTAPGSEMFEVMAIAMSMFTGEPVETVVKELDASTPQETRMDGREHQRIFRYVPDHIEVNGEVTRLYEARPHQWAQSMSDKAAKRFSFINNFGQNLFKLGEDGAVEMGSTRGAESKAVIGQIRESGLGEEVALRNLIRALNGVPIDVEMNLFRMGAGGKGRIGRTLARTAMGGVSMMKSAALSMAYLVNIPETFGNLAVATSYRDVMHGHYTVAKAVWDGNLGKLWADLRDLGIITEDVPYTALNSMFDVAGIKQAFKENRLDKELASRASILSAATKFANEYNDVISALAAIHQARRWMVEGGTNSDYVQLKARGYSDADAKRMVSVGGMQESEIATYAQRVTAQTQGGTEHNAERGTVQQMKLWNFGGVPFGTFAATTARMFRTISRIMASAYKAGITKGPEMFKYISEIIAKKSTSAAVSTMLKAILLFGLNGGLQELLKGWEVDPLKEAEEILWMAVGGGPADALRHQIDRSDEFSDFVNISYAVRNGSEVGGFVLGKGAYADMPIMDRLAEFGRRNMPVFRQTEIAWGDQELHAAKAMAYDWIKGQGYTFGSGSKGKDPTSEADDKVFQSSMKNAMRSLEAGDVEAFQDHVYEAAGAKGDASAAASLKARSVYATIQRMIGDERIPEVADHLGPRYWGAILSQKQAVEDLAKTLTPMSRSRPSRRSRR